MAFYVFLVGRACLLCCCCCYCCWLAMETASTFSLNIMEKVTYQMRLHHLHLSLYHHKTLSLSTTFPLSHLYFVSVWYGSTLTKPDSKILIQTHKARTNNNRFLFHSFPLQANFRTNAIFIYLCFQLNGFGAKFSSLFRKTDIDTYTLTFFFPAR